MKYLFILLLFLSSCYSQRKAQTQTDKALSRYPQVVAKIARGAFPCLVNQVDSSGFGAFDSLSSVVDSISGVIQDRTREIDSLRKIRPDTSSDCGTLIDQAYSYASKIDAENSNLKRSIKELRALPPRTITKTVEDSSKIFLAVYDANQLRESRDKYKAAFEAQKIISDNLLDRQRGKLLIPWWVPLILLLLTGLYFRKSITQLFMKKVIPLILIISLLSMTGCVNFSGTNTSVWSDGVFMIFWVPLVGGLIFLVKSFRSSSPGNPFYKVPSFYYAVALFVAALIIYFGVNSSR